MKLSLESYIGKKMDENLTVSVDIDAVKPGRDSAIVSTPVLNNNPHISEIEDKASQEPISKLDTNLKIIKLPIAPNGCLPTQYQTPDGIKNLYSIRISSPNGLIDAYGELENPEIILIDSAPPGIIPVKINGPNGIIDGYPLKIKVDSGYKFAFGQVNSKIDNPSDGLVRRVSKVNFVKRLSALFTSNHFQNNLELDDLAKIEKIEESPSINKTIGDLQNTQSEAAEHATTTETENLALVGKDTSNHDDLRSCDPSLKVLEPLKEKYSTPEKNESRISITSQSNDQIKSPTSPLSGSILLSQPTDQNSKMASIGSMKKITALSQLRERVWKF
jgi:hypothetical protein